MGLIRDLREQNAAELLYRSAEILQTQGLARGVMLDEDGSVDVTAALFLAARGNRKLLNQSGGIAEDAGVPDFFIPQVYELINAIEATVDDDINTWSDSADLDAIIKTLKKVSAHFN